MPDAYVSKSGNFYRDASGVWFHRGTGGRATSLVIHNLEAEYQNQVRREQAIEKYRRKVRADMGCDSGPGYSDIVKSDTKHDVITHPKHYTNKVPPTDKHPNGIECYEVIMWFPTMVGSAIKYLWRAGDKDDELQDLRKAKQFIDFRIEQIEQQRKHAQPEPQRKEPA